MHAECVIFRRFSISGVFVGARTGGAQTRLPTLQRRTTVNGVVANLPAHISQQSLGMGNFLPHSETEHGQITYRARNCLRDN